MKTDELHREARRILVRSKRLLQGNLGTLARSAVRGRGLTFEEVRGYQPGDDIRTIDWKVTARLGQPFVKSFLQERQQTIWILLDESASMRVGSATNKPPVSNGGTGKTLESTNDTRKTTGCRTKRDAALEMAVLLALSASMHQDKVGLMTFGDQNHLILPRWHRRQAATIIRKLLEPATNSSVPSLVTAVSLLRRTEKARGMVFVISDGLDPNVAEQLRPLCRQHEVYFVQVSDPWEHQLPRMGLVRFADSESGIQKIVDTSDEGFQRSYARAAQERVDQLRRDLANWGIRWISLQTDGSAAHALRTHFRLK